MLTIDRNDARPIWQQLLDQAIRNITAGHWPPGQLLLPSRELAQLLGVSRSTIQIVYEELFSRVHRHLPARRNPRERVEASCRPGNRCDGGGASSARAPLSGCGG